MNYELLVYVLAGMWLAGLIFHLGVWWGAYRAKKLVEKIQREWENN